MVAEACIIFKWQPEYVLAMPAVRFFAMLKAGKKKQYQDQSSIMANLCDIAAIAIGNKDYYEAIRRQFYFRSVGQEEMLDESRAHDLTKQSTKMALAAIFPQGAMNG